jgi:Na+/melibiose symporter-like transporter
MKRQLLYLSGQLGLMLQLRFFFQWILDFSIHPSNGVVIFSASAIGLLLLSFRIFDAVTDPLAGILSDHLVQKGYKRTFLMKICAPLISIGLIISFLPSSLFSPLINWIIITCGFFLFFSGYTLYCIPYWSLIEDLNHNNELSKQKDSSLLGLGIFIATAIGFVLTPILIDIFGYFESAVIIAISTIPFLYFPLLLDNKTNATSIKVNAKSYKNELLTLFEPLKNKKFIKVLLLLTVVQVSFTALTSISPVFVEMVLEKERGFLAKIMGPVIISAIITFLFFNRVLKKYSWQNVLKNSVFAQGLLFILVYPLFLLSKNPSFDFIILFGLFGIPIAFVLGLEALSVTKVNDNPKQIGIYFGAFNFIIKGFNGLSIMITGFVIDYVKSGNSIDIVPIFFSMLGIIILLSGFLVKLK